MMVNPEDFNKIDKMVLNPKIAGCVTIVAIAGLFIPSSWLGNAGPKVYALCTILAFIGSSICVLWIFSKGYDFIRGRTKKN